MEVNEPIASQSRAKSLLEKFKRVRNQSMRICGPLKTEDYVVQPVVDVSPPKWHLGHTTWFFEALVLEEFKDDYKAFDPDYGYMFNSYYETVGERVLRPNRGFMTRPTIDEVLTYRAFIDGQMEELLQSGKGDTDRMMDVIEVGINHEQQHQELMVTDIKYILGHNPLFPSYQPAEKSEGNQATSSEFLSVEEGLYSIGHSNEEFCYDNELGVHKVYLHNYEIMGQLVTSGEYLEFVESGAYDQFQWWYSEAWDWINEHKIKAPMYWHKIENKWHHYSLNGGLLPLEMESPVTHVSQYEADAFARWKGFRLPTEFEWEVACRMHQPSPDSSSNFIEKQLFQPAAPHGNNSQFFGDCWEWTNSAYLPYPYFKTADGALGEYNGKFMINQMVLRGGSCATPRDHIRPTYRNFFHPHLRWQFTGIRLSRSI